MTGLTARRASVERVAVKYAAKSFIQDFQKLVTHFKDRVDKAVVEARASLEMIARWFFKGSPFRVVGRPVVQMQPAGSQRPHVQLEVVPAATATQDKRSLHDHLRRLLRGGAEIEDISGTDGTRFRVTWFADWK